MTTYPDAEDYIRAVQQPDRVFRLPAMRSAVFEPHPLYGIPIPASGNAAVVFRAGVGGQDTALRFFLREDASTRERYTALGRHVAERGLADCLAGAVWLDDAITVNAATWPVVRMSWVDGRTLDAYAGSLAAAGDVAALASLAATWRGFVGRLQGAGFAHGDLQHGNVLIDTTGALRLVDFDGSWIAAFDGGRPPGETGHPNYQRTGREWGRWMDTFPGLVIYTALLALALRPGYWAELHTGENILFCAADFEPPFRTRAWELLAGIGDTRFDHAARALQRACAPGWRATGPLESLLAAPWWELTGAAAPPPAAPLPPPPPKIVMIPVPPPVPPRAAPPGHGWYQPAPPPVRTRRAGARVTAALLGLVAVLTVTGAVEATGLGAAAVYVGVLAGALTVVLTLRAWPRR
jgi:eukaryotic-like serine/threonine-protein kinase